LQQDALPGVHDPFDRRPGDSIDHVQIDIPAASKAGIDLRQIEAGRLRIRDRL
jgi:hypothetical protein